MNKFIITGSLAVAVSLAAVASSSAQIAAWDVQGHGSPIDVTLAATSSDPNLASIPSLARSGVTAGAAGNSFSASGWNTGATMDVTTNYFTVTLTPAAGYQLNLTSLDFNTCGSNTAPNNDAWGYSTDGGSTWTIETANTLTSNAVKSFTWDFADFSSASSVEFRYWVWGTNAIVGTALSSVNGTTRIANLAGNDLVFNGTVTTVVPEPTTLSLIGFGIFGMVAFSRRRFSRS